MHQKIPGTCRIWIHVCCGNRVWKKPMFYWLSQRNDSQSLTPPRLGKYGISREHICQMIFCDNSFYGSNIAQCTDNMSVDHNINSEPRKNSFLISSVEILLSCWNTSSFFYQCSLYMHVHKPHCSKEHF